MAVAFRRCGNRPYYVLTNYVTLSCAPGRRNESFRRAARADRHAGHGAGLLPAGSQGHERPADVIGSALRVLRIAGELRVRLIAACFPSPVERRV